MSSHWTTIPVGEALEKIARQKKVMTSAYEDSGSIPIIDQGREYIAGYTSDPEQQYVGKLPLTVFGDHTRILKWVDRPFAVGADGTQLLRGDDRFDQRFFYYALKSVDLKHFGYERHFKYLKEKEIPLPDLTIQRKIAGILSAYDDLIENNLRRIKILEEMAQSLYREWFVHFRFPGHESARFIDSPLGQIPKGWKATTLGEFVDNKSVHLQTGPFGTQLKASHYSHEGTPVINVRNIGFGTLRAEKLEFLPPVKVDELKRHQLRSGDIVFGRKGAVERHLLVGPVEDGWIQGSDCIRLRVVSGPLTPRFLSIGFREAEHQRWMMNQCSGGATMASLNQDILCRIPLAVPPQDLIAKFDKFSASAVDQVDLLASKILVLQNTRSLLLPHLLRS